MSAVLMDMCLVANVCAPHGGLDVEEYTDSMSKLTTLMGQEHSMGAQHCG